jgi:cytochrome P450
MNVETPAHVPARLVRDFDHHRDPVITGDPFTAFERYRDDRIFWTPAYGGYWVLTRSADIRMILCDATRFSNRHGSIPAAGWPRPLIRQELDPPEHGKYRALLIPHPTAGATGPLSTVLDAECARLAEHLAPAGQCDLVAGFSRPLQNALFTNLFDVPADHADQCAPWIAELLQRTDHDLRSRSVAAITQYVRHRIADQADHPQLDSRGLLPALMTAHFDHRPLTMTELLDIGFLMVMASLDTLANSLSFSFLAEHPEYQRRLARDPAIVPNAVEELLRLHSVVSIARIATCDTHLCDDVTICAGDRILLCLTNANRDPARYPEPGNACFERPDSNRNVAFGLGAHRCLGALVARKAMTSAIREFHHRIPAYHLAEDARPQVSGGAVCSLDSLPLTWPKRSIRDFARE